MPGPCHIPIAGEICHVIGGLASTAATSIAQTFVNGFADGMAKVTKAMLTFWVGVGVPKLDGAPTVDALHRLVIPLQGFVLVASLLYAAGRMALTRDGQPAAEAARGVVVMVVLTGAGVIGIDTLTRAGDAWASWALTQASGSGGLRLGSLTAGAAGMSGLGIGLEFLLALVGMLAAVTQIVLLLVRVGILTLLAGMLPVFAAGWGTPGGRASCQRVLAWIVGFLLYKPAAALVYFAAIELSGNGTDVTSIVAGIALMSVAVLALPAVLRLAVPLVAAAASGGGGAVGGAVAGGALAAGARSVGSPSAGGGSHRARRTSGAGTGPTFGTGPGPSAATGAKTTGGGAAVGKAGAVGAAATAAAGRVRTAQTHLRSTTGEGDAA